MLPGIEMNYSTPAPIHNVSIEIYTKENMQISTRIIIRIVNFTCPDQTTLEGSGCTSVMTYTRGSGYSF